MGLLASLHCMATPSGSILHLNSRSLLDFQNAGINFDIIIMCKQNLVE